MGEEATTAPPWGIPDPRPEHSFAPVPACFRHVLVFTFRYHVHLFVKRKFFEEMLPEHMFICRTIIIVVCNLFILFIFHTQFISHINESIDSSAFKLSDNYMSIRQRVQFRSFIHNSHKLSFRQSGRLTVTCLNCQSIALIVTVNGF